MRLFVLFYPRVVAAYVERAKSKALKMHPQKSATNVGSMARDNTIEFGTDWQ